MIEILKSITLGSWLTAGIIILVRLIFCRGISARAKYLLWLLLMVRLMVPVLPESDFGILDRPDIAVVEADISDVVLYEYPAQTMTESETTIVMSESEASADTEWEKQTTAIGQTEQERGIVLHPLWIWGIGMVLCFAAYFTSSVKTALGLRKAVCVDDPEALRCYIRVRKLLGVKREIRFCYGAESLIGGFIKPTLLIPRELSGEKLEAAVIHELMHYRSGDLWIIALQRILCCIHWFNPVVWICFYWARQDCEKACDQRVMELVSPTVYAELLLQETMLKRRPQIGTTAFGSGNIKHRFRAIMNYKRPAFYMTVLAVVVILFAAFFTLTARENGPWRWTKALERTDVTRVTVTCTGQQKNLSEDEIHELLCTINALEKREFEENEDLAGSTPDTSIEIVCGEEIYHINRADVPYGQFEMNYGGKQWWFDSEALNETLNDILAGLISDDLSPAMHPLSILLNVPEESIMEGLERITIDESFDAVNNALDTLMGEYITDDFKAYFSGGTGIGDLWLGALCYGYSTSSRELKVTADESDETNFNYETTLEITLQNGEVYTVSFGGIVRCNRNYKVTSISIEDQSLRDFHEMLGETQSVGQSGQYDEATAVVESYKPKLQELRETLYSDFNLSGDFYQAKNTTLTEFLAAVPSTVSLTLSTGDIIWRVPRADCAAVANEISANNQILVDAELDYGYFYLKNDASFGDLAEKLGFMVCDEEGDVLTKLECVNKYPNGTFWATVYFENASSDTEGIYLFELELSDSDLTVLSMQKK